MKMICIGLLLLFSVLSCAHQSPQPKIINSTTSIVEFRIVYETHATGRVEATLPHAPGRGFLGPLELSVADLAVVRFVAKPNPPYARPISTIELVLSPQGATKFGTLTRNNINRRLAIMVKGKVLTAPVIHEEITDDTIQIVGRFTEEEARGIVNEIEMALKSSNQAL